jgi:hypothetical protein
MAHLKSISDRYVRGNIEHWHVELVLRTHTQELARLAIYMGFCSGINTSTSYWLVFKQT